jgi:hypothetical protein
MGLRPIQGNEKRLGPVSALYGAVTLSLSSRAKPRICSSAGLSWKNRTTRQNELSSRPKRSDLRFRRPFVEMFFWRAREELRFPERAN